MPPAGRLDRLSAATPSARADAHPAFGLSPPRRPGRLCRVVRDLRQDMRGRCHRGVLRAGAVRQLTAGDRSRSALATTYLTSAVRCCRARGRVFQTCCCGGRCLHGHGCRHGLRCHDAQANHGEPAYPRAENHGAGCRRACAAVRHRSLGSQQAAAAPRRGVLVSRVAPDRDRALGSAARTPCHHTIRSGVTGILSRPAHSSAAFLALGERLPGPVAAQVPPTRYASCRGRCADGVAGR